MSFCSVSVQTTLKVPHLSPYNPKFLANDWARSTGNPLLMTLQSALASVTGQEALGISCQQPLGLGIPPKGIFWVGHSSLTGVKDTHLMYSDCAQ